VLIPLIPMVAMQSIGAAQKGTTQDLFTAVTPQPTVEIFNAVQPPEAVISLGGNTETISGNTHSYSIVAGTDSSNQPTAAVTFDENGIYQEICSRAMELCDGSNGQYRLVQVDLRPGGAIMYADVNYQGFQQRVGAVTTLDASGRHFEVQGIDINGTLFSAPEGEIAALAEEVEQKGNEALDEISLQAAGTDYSLSNIVITDESLVLVMQ
jgi:hypothetical protein